MGTNVELMRLPLRESLARLVVLCGGFAAGDWLYKGFDPHTTVPMCFGALGCWLMYRYIWNCAV